MIEKIIKIILNTHGSTMLKKLSKNFSPFQILITAILSARAKDEITEKISKILLKRYPSAKELAKADLKEIKQIIKPIGFYNNKAKMIIKCAKQILTIYHNKVPKEMKELLTLSGVGRKVAGCVRVYAFHLDSLPVDVHVHRVANRIGLVHTKNPFETERALKKITPKKMWKYVNEAFVRLGRSVCLPRNPKCKECPVKNYCDYFKKNKFI